MRLPCLSLLLLAAPLMSQGPASAPLSAPATPGRMTLQLPTDNDALFRNDGPGFYMFVDRNFEKEQSTPWEGGQFGFVRGPVRFGPQVVQMAFHEGIDIAPVKRDAAGEPIDKIYSISHGEVVHVSDAPGASNYGRYIVIRHDWGQGPFYSLYAHLSSCLVTVGAKVEPGSAIAVMGHTGAGIDRRRSHVHVELNMFLSSRFEDWHSKNFRPSPNHHGVYNGLNLSGMNIAGLYLEHRKNPALTVADFVKSSPEGFKIVTPRKGELELVKMYPWLGEGLAQSSPSWEFTLNESGLPMRVKPSSVTVNRPTVTWVRDVGLPHAYHCRGYVSGSGNTGALTASGARLMELITGDFVAPPPLPEKPAVKKKK
ncbi:peptidase M23-like protein [Roseimicrobium gellanilyticum]|uniref:Peptidase M23-like protein n=1 Tax=Roseimicrobium gellanilyticum TaxID=748857 RepID=A0A366H2X1_9BACT|nr:M23 family metallopeptidase [Roseimicrobium gellanilyticum]RBP35125.1 peptidase M23-like protein [Roseimicrobium gellanilyticum]